MIPVRMKIVLNLIKYLFVSVVFFVSNIPQIQANNETPDGSDFMTAFAVSKHRLDLSLNLQDAGEGDITTIMPGYTLSIGASYRLSVNTSYLSSTSYSGLGDSYFVFQYDPSEHLTASPWLPDNFGLNTTIRVPTGNADKGFGLDSWYVNLGIGLAFNLDRSLWLLPSVYYATTFSEEIDAIPEEETGIGLNFTWLFKNGFWAGYEPTFVRDLISNEWANDHTLILGKIFRNGYGLGFEYGRHDRLDPTALRDDYTGLVNIYYLFGQIR